MIHHFSRVYRNLAKSYKGWRVYYRKPESSQDYGTINEKFGVIKDPKLVYVYERSIKQILNYPMVWMHDLKPLVVDVEINGAESCEFIATQLNDQLLDNYGDLLLKKWSPYMNELTQNYHKLVEPNSKLLTNHETWQTFSKNLQTIHGFSKQLSLTSFKKNCTMSSKNVYDVLMSRQKNSKGWTVKILEN